jgi:uncharacterized membrane protein (DUF106 family)
MIILNFILAVLFWYMVDPAMEDDRPGWAFWYLVCSAMNGAVILTTIF